jgi:histidyl-tRNA synthetase
VNADRLVSLARYLQGTPSESAVENIRAILVLVDGTPAEARVLVEPRLARGLSYYTGAIMEIAVPDLAGSLGGGGRYDHLIGMFLGREIPACGFSLGLERLIVVMTERGLFEGKVAAGALDVMVALWPEQLGEAMALASELRRAGLRVEVYPDADRLAKQFKYAAGHHVPFVAVVGEDERAKGEVSLKDLRTGEQNSVPAREAAAFVSRQLGPLAVSKGR